MRCSWAKPSRDTPGSAASNAAQYSTASPGRLARDSITATMPQRLNPSAIAPFKWLSVLGVLLAGCSSTPPPDPQTAYGQALVLAVQGRMSEALPQFKRIDLAALEPKRRENASAIVARFDRPEPAPAPADLDPWTAEVLATYRRYWSRVMLGRTSPDAGERELAQGLARLLGPDAPPAGEPPAMTAIESQLRKRIEAQGLHAQFGVTIPLREFMLWRAQDVRHYEVALPEGVQQVRVTMLEGFVSHGWVGYATADRAFAGGWATAQGLYCVRAAYDLDSEAFRVSYLAHEGQHFADAHAFPELEQPALEYRAKLVEVAQAHMTLDDLLAGFDTNQSDSREQPHAYANRRLLMDLQAATGATGAAWWKAAGQDRVRAAAAQLLRADSTRLRGGLGSRP